MGKIKGRLFVIEGKRLLPILFLLVLLVSLSIYDNFRVDTTAKVFEEVKIENEIKFFTTDQGRKKVEPVLRLAGEQEDWAEIAREFGLELPDYPFNPHGEVGIFVMNGKIDYIQTLPQADTQVQVRISVDVKDNYYHLATVEKKSYQLEGKEYLWVLTDNKGKVLDEQTLGEEKPEGVEKNKENPNQ
ncbi:MAG: hypothetical protein CVU88_02855 [Firmicutes bacterium HGW-Firmicutes-13]|nr:MAG: hypothetical protein CVU88_02855 [Firmicutes bacterium HGW-Firmicutes-13]